MRVLGWLGTILCAPFYCFFMLMDKLKVLYWIPIGTGVYGAYLVFVGVQSIIQDSMGSGAVIFILHAVIVGSFFACWVFLGVLVWHLLFIANNLIYMLVNLLLIPFAYGFTYCNAWRQGMSKCELEGKLAYIQHEKDLRKQEITARRDYLRIRVCLPSCGALCCTAARRFRKWSATRRSRWSESMAGAHR